MSNLLVELMLLTASSPGFVHRVSFTHNAIYVERGPDAIPQDFEPSQFYFNRGEPVPKLGIRLPQPASFKFASPTIVIKHA